MGRSVKRHSRTHALLTLFVFVLRGGEGGYGNPTKAIATLLNLSVSEHTYLLDALVLDIKTLWSPSIT